VNLNHLFLSEVNLVEMSVNELALVVLFSNLDGDWKKVLLFNLQSYGGERILTFQKEKLKEVAMKLTNPFWKDVLSSYRFAKPYTKMNTDKLLSLDILNFVPVTDLNYYI
jgi:hypothetical protein